MRVSEILHSQIQDYQAVKISEIGGGEDTEAWKVELVLRFSHKEPSQPLFLVKSGGRDSKYSNKALNGEGAFYGAGSKVEHVTREEAKEWVEDNGLNEVRLEKALEAHETIQELRNN